MSDWKRNCPFNVIQYSTCGSGSLALLKVSNCSIIGDCEFPRYSNIAGCAFFYYHIMNILSQKTFNRFRFSSDFTTKSPAFIVSSSHWRSHLVISLDEWQTDGLTSYWHQIVWNSGCQIISNGILTAVTVDRAKTSFLYLLSVSLSVLWWILFQLWYLWEGGEGQATKFPDDQRSVPEMHCAISRFWLELKPIGLTVSIWHDLRVRIPQGEKQE